MKRTTAWLANLLQHHPKNIFCLASAALLLSLGIVPAFAQTEPTVWAHKVCWTTINNHSHTQRRDFPLGMGNATWPGQPKRAGDQTSVDDTTDCALAQSAGIDAFALDLIPSMGLTQNQGYMDCNLNAAAAVRAETGKPFYISPCIDTPGQLTPSQLALLIQGLMAGRAQRPEWPKLNGVPIVWTYDATAMSASYWQQTFTLLNALNVQVYIVLDAGSVFSQANSSRQIADLNVYATLPVGLYSFSTESSQAGAAFCRQYLAQNYPNSLAAQMTVGTVWPGYWNKAAGWYVDPQGTKLIRDSFAAASSSRWITVTTWDDYGENTHFEPSINLGTGRLDLLHSLIAAWRGQSWPSKSQFYLWQPNEIHGTEPLTGEALALVAAAPATVQINLCDKNQNILASGTPVTFTTPGVHTVPYTFTLSQLPADRSAYLSLVCQAADTPVESYLSVPVAVWPYGDNPWRTLTGVMWQAGTQTVQPPVTITNSGTIPQIEAGQYADFGGQFFPRLNSNLVTFPSFGSSQFTENLGDTTTVGQYAWDVFSAVPTAQRWGFFDAKGVDAGGMLHWSPPVWVEPSGGFSAVTSWWHFDEGTGATASDASLYGNSVTLQGGAGWTKPGLAGAASLWLDGTTGKVSVPAAVFPRGSFTFQAQVKPYLPGGATAYTHDQTIFCDVAGALNLCIRADGRLQAQRSDSTGWQVATSTTVVPANQWTLVTVTYDQKALRLYYKNHLEAITPCTSVHTTTTTTLGYNPFATNGGYFCGNMDELQIQSQAVPPAGSNTTILTPDQQVNLWHCDEGTGTVATNATPYALALNLPAGVSWCKPGQSGAAGLSLDGATGKVTLPQGDFPHATFSFQTQVKPYLPSGTTTYARDQYLFCDIAGALIVCIRADGRLQAQRTDGSGAWKYATGVSRVPANQWSLVTVTYDQQTLKVYLNNALEASVACTGTHVNMTAALGCNPSGGGYLSGSLDEILIQPSVLVPSARVAVTPPTPDQQVNLWHCDEGTGTKAANSTAQGISLTLPAGVSWCKPGQSGAAGLSLDGATGKVTLPQGDFPHATFSFQTQVKPYLPSGTTTYAHDQYLFCDVAGALALDIRADGRLQVQRTDGSGAWKYATGVSRVPANQWSLVTVTYDQQTLKVYLNNALEASVACTGTHVNTNTALGCNPYGGSYFNGSLDEILIQP